MEKNRNLTSKTLYGLIFLFVLPYGLILWAQYTEDIIIFPAIESANAGWILIIAGGLLLLLAMLSLIKYGKGLPMNAYPPKLFVDRGPYRIFHHPIYWGFGILIVGYFILIGSASGLWLVAPLTILGMIALVLGHENIDLKKRFSNKSIKTVLDLPDKIEETASFGDRISALFWIGVSLLLANFLAIKLTGNTPALFGGPLVINYSIENQYFYYLGVLFLIMTPFILKRKDIIREWAVSGIIALGISVFMTVLYPSVAAQYLPYEGSIIIIVPIYLLFISLKSIFRQSKLLGIFFSLVVTVLMVFHLKFSPSAELSFGCAILIFMISSYYFQIWMFLRKGSEKIANSWKEWKFGKVRIINHGFYVGFGSFFGILLSGFLAGDEYAWAILLFAIIVIVFSALWAQIIEGSEKLKRPYGYYGALVGIIFASLAVWAIGFNVWVIIGVISVSMPWVQAIGRLRCLINGCCHGKKVDNQNIGIRYFHHRSRVFNISGLKGELLHPTPLYSIIWLFLIGFILLSLWNHHFSSPFIFGLYLILTGMGRFVEEAYRGEVQTPIIKGLPLYQWTAILSIIIGIIMTTIKINSFASTPDFGWQTVLSAFIGGLFTTFAMGVDFPNSNARFSRLV